MHAHYWSHESSSEEGSSEEHSHSHDHDHGHHKPKGDQVITFPNACPVGRIGFYNTYEVYYDDAVPNNYATMMACELGQHYCKV